MARIFASSSDNLVSGQVVGTGPIIYKGLWVKVSAIGTGSQFWNTGASGSAFNRFTLQSDFNGNHHVSAATTGAASTVESESSTVIGTGAWHYLSAWWIANNSRKSGIDGGSYGTGSSTQTPSGVNATRFNGRLSDGANGAAGTYAHPRALLRNVDAQEDAFLATGGNPRAMQSLTYYSRFNQAGATDVADVGSLTLTVNGTTMSNADMPVIASHFIGSNIADQVWTQNSAITAISYSGAFEDVSSTFTLAIYHIGASGGTTTTTTGGTVARLIPLTSSTGFVANDYLTVGAGAMTRILSISGNTVLVANDQTFSGGDTVTHFPVALQAFTGITTNTTNTSGTPTGTQATLTNCFTRAVNSTTASLVADSNLYSITINAAAGGGVATFTVPPAVTATTGGFSLLATVDQTATAYLVALIKGSPLPTAALVRTGSPTGFVARFTTAATAATPFTLAATGLVLPLYDIHEIVNNVNGDSSVQSFTNRQKLPAAGRQYQVEGALSATSPFNLVTPAVAVGDVLDIVLLTPAGYPIVPDSSGDFIVSSGGDEARQLVAFNLYDVSAGAMYYTGDSTLVLNDQAPVFTGDPLNAFVIVLPRNAAITAQNLPTILGMVDPEADAITYTETTALLATIGLAIDGSFNIVGATPDAISQTTIGIRAADPYLGLTDVLGLIAIGQIQIPDPGVLTETAYRALLVTDSLAPGTTTWIIDLTPVGAVISTSPPVGTLVNFGSTVDITASGVAAPNVVGLSYADAQTAATAAGMVLAGGPFAGVVASQTPLVGVVVEPASILFVNEAQVVSVPLLLSRVDVSFTGLPLGQALTPQLVAGQTLQIIVRALNSDMALMTPVTVRYRIDDVNSGQAVLEWTTATPANPTVIAITPANNVIRNRGSDFERRQIMVEVSDAVGTVRKTQDYLLMNTLGSP